MRSKRKTPQQVAEENISSGADPEGFRMEMIPPKGRGVRTTVARFTGDFLLTYAGECISGEEGKRREKESESTFRYFFVCRGKDWCIDSTKEVNSGHWLGRLVNHGKKKDQNCKMKCIETKASQKPHLCLFAIKDIPAGHELLYDYGISDLPWERKTDTDIQMCAASVNLEAQQQIHGAVPGMDISALEADHEALMDKRNCLNPKVSETDSNPDNTIMQSSYDNLRNLIDRIRGTKHLAASQKHLSQDYKIANIQLQEQKFTDNLKNMLEAKDTDNVDNMQKAKSTGNLENILECQTSHSLGNMLKAETTDNLENILEGQTTHSLKNMLKAETTDNLENILEGQTTHSLENMMMAETTDNGENILEGQTTHSLENMLEAETTDNLENILEGQTTHSLENMLKPETTDKLENILEGQTTHSLENMLKDKTTDNLENILEGQTTHSLENMLKPETTDKLENILEGQTTHSRENILEDESTDNLESMLQAQIMDSLEDILEAVTSDNHKNMQVVQTTDSLENMQEAQTTDSLENMLEAKTTDNLKNFPEAQTTDNLEFFMKAQTTDNLEYMLGTQTTNGIENMLQAQTTESLEDMLEAQTTDTLENKQEVQTTDSLENMQDAKTTENLKNFPEAQTTDNLEFFMEAQTTDNLQNMLGTQTTDRMENMLQAQTSESLENMLEAQTTDTLENKQEVQTTDSLENMQDAKTTENLKNFPEAQTTDNLEFFMEAQTTDNLQNMLGTQTTDRMENMLQAQTSESLENMLEAQTTDTLENKQEVQTTDSLESMQDAKTTENLKNFPEAQTTDNLEFFMEAQTTDNLQNMLGTQTTERMENMLQAQTTESLENMLEAQTTDTLENIQEVQITDTLENMQEVQTTDSLENMQVPKTTYNMENMLEAQTTDTLENMLMAQTTDSLENMLEAQTTDSLENMQVPKTTYNMENMLEAQTTANLKNMQEAQVTDTLENIQEVKTTDTLENMQVPKTTDNMENMQEVLTTANLKNMQEAQTTDTLENMLMAQTTDSLENMLEAQTTDILENMLEAKTTDNLEIMLEAQNTDSLENMQASLTTDNLEKMLEAKSTDNLKNMQKAYTTDSLKNVVEAQTTDSLKNLLEAQTTDNLKNMLEAQTSDNQKNMLEAQTTDMLQAQSTDNLVKILDTQTVTVHANKIQDQISDNNALMKEMAMRLSGLKSVQTAAEELIKQVTDSQDDAVKDLPHGTNKFWDNLHQLTHTLKHLSDRLANREPTVESSLVQEQQETLEDSNVNPLNQAADSAIEPMYVEGNLLLGQSNTINPHVRQGSTDSGLDVEIGYSEKYMLKVTNDSVANMCSHSRNFGRRQVAVVDPSKQISENELECDYDGLPLDDESVVLSSGSSYAPSVLSGDETEENEDDDSSVIIPVIQSNKRSWTATERVAASEDTGDDEPPRKQRTLSVLGPSTYSKFDATSKNTSDEHHWKTWKKSCFKNVYVESYNSNDGKRNYSKKAYCYYCKNLYKSKMSKHLFAVHAAEPRVRKISQMALKSKIRKAELQKLKNEGNFNHNVQVLQKGEGNLIVYRRPAGEANAYDYVHCRFCRGFYHYKLLWSHVKTCDFKPDGAENDTERNFIREARCEIAPFLHQQDEDIEMLDEVVDKMKETKENPGLKKICQEDELIRQFGLYLLGRLGRPEEQRLKDQDNVRTKMRSLARLLVKLNEEELFGYPLSHFISAEKFDLVAKTVKEMYQEIGSSQLGLNLGHYIKQVSLLKSSMCLRRQDFRQKRDANEFTEMFDAEWKGKVSSVANRSKRLKTMNNRSELPSTEDLVLLKKFLVEEIQLQMENTAPTYAEYVYMTHLLIARIALFNKRRVNEVSELTVSDFKKRIRGDELDTNTEIYNSLAVSEKALLKRMELLEVRGKSTRGLRKVFVILSTDMVEGLSHLLMVRAQAGVPLTNTFLFSRCTDSPQDGCQAMRVVTSKCPNLAFPERVRTTKLRKYLATTTQIMDMRDDELKLLADHMGHSVAIHTEVYRMQTSVLERTKVARALLALEDGRLQGFNGRSLSSVSLDELPEPEPEPYEGASEPEPEPYEGASFEELPEPDNSFEDAAEVETEAVLEPSACRGSKKRWSKEEESALWEAFAVQLKEKKNVGSAEIRKAQKCFPVLQGRTEAVIRTKINNIKLGKNKRIN